MTLPGQAGVDVKKIMIIMLLNLNQECLTLVSIDLALLSAD